VVPLSDDLRLDRQMRHHIEVVIDRLAAGSAVRPRLAEAVELALRMGEGNLIIAVEPDGKQRQLTKPPPDPEQDADEADDRGRKSAARRAGRKLPQPPRRSTTRAARISSSPPITLHALRHQL